MNPEQQAQLTAARIRRAAALGEIELLTIEYLNNLAHLKNARRQRNFTKDADRRAYLDREIEKREATQARQRAALKREKAQLNQADQTKRALLKIKAQAAKGQ